MAKETEKNEEIIQLVSFNIGAEEFGVDILQVQEINKLVQVTKVPNSPIFVEGVINLRGKVIPIVDLRTRLGMEKRTHDKNTRSIVVEIEGKTIGFVVDSVNEVLRIPKSITEAPPAIVAGIDANYITSVAKMEDRLLILLDLDKILTTEEKKLIGKVS
ncbi:MAG TPA: chemotaxis protein CheW [Ignavibacteriales bacterium]|nr:chemotaxis protein CheW [Ignavibacteriales bacterium]